MFESRQLRHYPHTLAATRATHHIDLGHTCHERTGRFAGRRVVYWHVQRRLRLRKLHAFTGRIQYAVMPDALDAGWQNVQQEAANERGAGQSDCAFAPCVVGAHCEVFTKQ